jgi:hypothetical protein
MIRRVCRVSGVLLAWLTAASVCLAAEPAHDPGKGGVGGQLGIASFRGDRMLGSNWFGDYSAGALPRPAFNATFRYVFRPWLRAQLATGLTWAAYKGDEPAPFVDVRFGDATKKEYLTLLVPISLQAQWVVRRGWWIYHVGAGPGVYRVWVQNRREVLKDPETLRLHRGVYPGASGEIGFELFLRQLPTTSVELTIGGDMAFAERPEQFPNGFNSHVMALGARLGGNYYFSPGLGRKKETTPPATTP